MTEMTDNDDLPWQTLPIDPSDPSLGTAQHATSIPYLPSSHSLQTLDLCLVPARAPPDGTSTIPAPDSDPDATTPTFLVYIHGGAWRDPRQDSTTFQPTLTALLRRRALAPPHSRLRRLTGFASVNYTLSPHPDFPPSSDDDRAARAGAHPSALLDVLAALRWLQRRFRLGGRGRGGYLLVGHSCGATLALQSLPLSGHWTAAPADGRSSSLQEQQQQRQQQQQQQQHHHPPRALIALAGLYDLPQLVRSPGPAHAQHRGIYDALTRGAFGDDEGAWAAASPACLRRRWGDVDVPLAVLAYSRGDTLVPPNQADAMAEALGEGGWRGEVGRVELTGDHDVWRFGAEQIVDVVEHALRRLPEIGR